MTSCNMSRGVSRGHASARILSILALLAIGTAGAAPRIDLYYQLDLEAHQERDDEARSALLLGLSDDRVASRLKLNYDLQGRYFYDHVDKRDNTQWSGRGELDYRLSRSLSGVAELSLAEVADPGVQIEDELDTQTLAQGQAGLQWQSVGPGRGQFSAALLREFFRYQNSDDLDADENRFDLGYRYRFSDAAALSLGYSRFEQRYVDPAQSSLDTDNDQWQIGFDRRWTRLGLQLFANTRKVELDDGSSDRFEGYGLELSHQANSRNRLSLRLARDLQQAFRFNTLLGNGLDRLEQAGLVQTDSLRLRWNYTGRFTRVDLSLYQDDLEVLNGSAAGDGRQRGGTLLLNREINARLSGELSATSLRNDLDSNETDLQTLALEYQWIRSQRFDLRVRLEARGGEEAGADADDTSLILQGRARLF